MPPDFITIYQLITGQQQDKVLSGDDQALLTEFLLRLIPPVDLEQFAVQAGVLRALREHAWRFRLSIPKFDVERLDEFPHLFFQAIQPHQRILQEWADRFPPPSAVIKPGAELDAIPSVWTVRFNETGSWSFVAGKEEQEEADFALFGSTIQSE